MILKYSYQNALNTSYEHVTCMNGNQEDELLKSPFRNEHGVPLSDKLQAISTLWAFEPRPFLAASCQGLSMVQRGWPGLL